MRTAVGAVSKETVAANTAIGKSSTDAAASQGKLVASVEQTRQAWEEAGGDMDVFARKLAALSGASEQTQAPLQRLTDSTRAITLAQLQAIEMDKRYEASKTASYQRVT